MPWWSALVAVAAWSLPAAVLILWARSEAKARSEWKRNTKEGS